MEHLRWLLLYFLKVTRETINVSAIAVIDYFLTGYLSEASVIDSKYIKMTGLQDFY